MLRSAGRLLGPPVLYGLLAVVCLAPVSLHPASRIPAYPGAQLHEFVPHASGRDPVAWEVDAGIAAYVMAWDIGQLLRAPLRLFEAPIYHPYPHALAMSDNFLGLALLGMPVWLLTGNLNLMFNSVFWLACLLTGWATYGYARSLWRDEWAALVAGGLMTVLPYQYGHIARPHRALLAAYPLSLWLIDRWRRRRRARDAGALGAVLTFQVISTWYISFTLAALVVSYLVFLAITRGGEILNRRLLVHGALAAAIVLPVLAFCLRPYVENRVRIPSLSRGDRFQAQYCIRPLDYFSVARENLLYGGTERAWMPVARPMEALFPGFVVLGLAAAGAWSARRRTGPRGLRFMLILLAGSLVLSFGIYLESPWGRIPMPYAGLLKLCPPLRALKLSYGFPSLVMFALVVLAGGGAHRLLAGRSPRTAGAATLLLLAVALAESLRPEIGWARLPEEEDLPAAYLWLAEQCPPRVTASLVFRRQRRRVGHLLRFEVPRGRSMLGALFHGHPILEGHTSYVPPASRDYFGAMRAFPSPATVSLLQAAGAEWLVVLVAEPALVSEARRRLRPHAELEELLVFPDSLVYRVQPPAAPAEPLRMAVALENGQAAICLHNPGPAIVSYYPEETRLTFLTDEPGPAGPTGLELTVEAPYIILPGQTFCRPLRTPDDRPLTEIPEIHPAPSNRLAVLPAAAPRP